VRSVELGWYAGETSDMIPVIISQLFVNSCVLYSIIRFVTMLLIPVCMQI